MPGIQLVHAGRKGSTGRPWPDANRGPETWGTVGASPLSFGRLPSPSELSIDEVESIVQSFAASARRAAVAGFKVLKLHGGHGYPIHQFLSPNSNIRTDRYGGSLENRMRFGLDVVRTVRQSWPAGLPLFFRASATDWLGSDTDDPRPGWTVDDTVELASRLKELGVDLMDVSSGRSAPHARIPRSPLGSARRSRSPPLQWE